MLPQVSAEELERLWPYFTDEQKAFIKTIVANDPALWRPISGPQTMAYYCDADVLGYGGAAGGGKTDLAIGKALTKHRKSAIFRRYGTELTAVHDRIVELLGSSDGFNGKDNIWRLQNLGLQIEYGAIPNLGDEAKHQGRPKDLLVLEEAANMVESQARFLMGWVRTVLRGQRCQTLMTFNPPTKSEGRWIIDFYSPWIDKHHPMPALPGELRYFVTVDGVDKEVTDGRKRVLVGGRLRTEFDPKEFVPEDILTPQTRTFIPARVSDNPYLAGTGYMATLQALPEPLRSQMLYGDFTAGIEDDEWQVIPTEWVELAMQRWKKRDRKNRMDSQGVDVARGGQDNTIIYRRHEDWWFDEALVYPGKRTPDGPSVAGLVIASNRNRAPIHIDVVGVGASPYDFLVNAGFQTIGVNGGEGSNATDKSGRLGFADMVSEIWWKAREALDPDANNGIAIPPEKQLLADLTAPRWTLRGKVIKVEGRKELLNPRRLGRSPDWGSAFCLACMETPRVSDLERRPEVPTGHAHDPYGNLDAAAHKRSHDPYA